MTNSAVVGDGYGGCRSRMVSDLCRFHSYSARNDLDVVGEEEAGHCRKRSVSKITIWDSGRRIRCRDG